MYVSSHTDTERRQVYTNHITDHDTTHLVTGGAMLHYRELPTFCMQSRPGKGNCQEGTLSAVKPVKMTRVLL